MSSLDAMVRLVDALGGPAVAAADVIEWATPVPYFGRIADSVVATVGINPSNLEFFDRDGAPLSPSNSRLPTLRSLGRDEWKPSDRATADRLLQGCSDYFESNPYRSWFDALDRILAPSGFSYYSTTPDNGTACHVDVVPYATKTKWGALTSAQRESLLGLGLAATAEFLRESPITLLLLNGSSVARVLKAQIEELETHFMPAWNLPRKTSDVIGIAYRGQTTQLAGIDLGRQICVLGWNHNIQSSFGVTSAARSAIAGWISRGGKV